MSVNSDNLKHI